MEIIRVKDAQAGGEKAFELMTGKKMPSEEIKKALLEKLEI